MANEFVIKNGFRSQGDSEITGSINISATASAAYFTGSFYGNGSGLVGLDPYVENLITVGSGSSDTAYTSIKTAIDSIIDSSVTNRYTVQVGPGIFIEDTMTVPEYVTVRGDSSISTIVSASNPSQSIFLMSDQSMVIDMQIQGSTAPGVSAVVYQSDTTPQTFAIAYVENVRFGTNYTNAKVIGSGSANIIMQCSNVKYGGFTDASIKTFDVGFHVTNAGSGIGRMQLRNVTSTNGGITGSADQIFALADAPGCAFIVNGCLLTRSAGSVAGTGFKVYNGGALRLTGVNWQRWTNGIWAPQTGSAPSINAIALNFENCTTDVLIEHTGSTGKVQGTDNFLKTDIPLDAPLYEVGQDPRRITVGKKGADFTSIASAVDWISGSGANNRFIVDVGPGQFTEPLIDLSTKPYVSIVGSNIQTTEIFPSASNHDIIKIGINNEVSFLTIANAGAGQSGILCDDIGDFAQLHKVSIYDCDTCIKILSNTQDTYLFGEYVDFNGAFTYGTYISASNGFIASANMENYYTFPVSAGAAAANYVTGPSSSLKMYSGVMTGESEVGSMAVYLENGADLQAAGFDFPDWNHAIHVSDVGVPASFNIVGCMIHGSVEYDFFIEPTTAVCRFQGTAAHTKISNASNNFYWSFLDELDGEFDITNNLAVTFADGTHTDASTLIFEGSTMGVLTGGTITVSGSLDINVAAGKGYAEKAGATEVYVRVDWPAQSLTLPANSNEYIYFTSAGTLTSNTSFPSEIENIVLGRVVTNDTTIEFIDQSPVDSNHTSNKYSRLFREALGPIYAFGSVVTENGTTPFQLDVTAGEYYYSSKEFMPAGGTDITFTRYYTSGSGWNRSTTQTVPSDVYASGSVLTAMSASYYTKHTLYLVGDGVDEMYMLVINDNQYSSLVSAEDAALPTIPTYFSDGVTALAAVYVQSGSANITQIQDIRPTIGFRAAGVNASSVHANLLGLTSDDHQQYLLVNGTRAMGGNLNMGGYDISNIGTLIGTASWAENSQTASYVDFTNIDNKPTLVSGSSQISYTGLTNIPAGIISSSAQIATDISGAFASDSASFDTRISANETDIATLTAATASYVLVSQTSSMSVLSAETASYVLPLIQDVYITGSLTVSGSGLPGLNTSASVLTDSSNISSVSWNIRSLYDLSGGDSLRWEDRELYDSAGVLSVGWSGRYLYDQGAGNSIEWDNRRLIDSVGSTILDWETATFTGNSDTSTTASYALTASYLLGSIASASYAETASYALTAQTLLGSVVSAETASYVLPLNQGVIITGSLLVSGSGGYIDTFGFALSDANGTTALRWDVRALNDTSDVTSINYDSRTLIDSSAVTAANYNARILSDSTALRSINWETRELTDGNEIAVVDWNNKILYDQNTSGSIDWNARLMGDENGVSAIFFAANKRSLIDNAGNQVLNFTNPGLATFDGTSSLATTASYILGSNVDGNITGNANNITAYTINQNLSTTSQVTFAGVTASLNGNVTGNLTGNAATATYAAEAGFVTNAATFNNGGAGAASGTTYNGSAAQTISYNTIGAPSTSGTNATGTWGIDITGNAATATTATSATTAATASYIQASNIDGVIQPRATSIASSATPTPDADTTDIYIVTALATGATLGAPTGTPVQGQKLTIRIKDNGGAQTLAYNAAYRAFGATLPTTTTASKTLYLGCIYNSTDAVWDVVAVTEQV